MPHEMMARPVLLVTGLSGAGMSSCLKILEDMGFEAVDNLPLFLLPALVRQGELWDRPLAVGIDSRTRDFNAQDVLAQYHQLLQDDRLDARLLFLDCQDDMLLRRFSETRRRHPLALDRPVQDGIARERQLLQPLAQRADMLLDTSNLSLPGLRQILAAEFGKAKTHPLTILVMSFSYRRGLPREADLVFDVRFLDNPHYVAELRPLTGLDARVQEYVASDPDFALFFNNLTGLLEPLLPRFAREGKSYLTLAVGCTGGKHRSVTTAEKLGAWLNQAGHAAAIVHRDIPPAPSTHKEQ